MKEILRQYTNYMLIAIISLLALVFFPMLGSSVGLDMALPDTTTGWIVWIVIKLLIAIINVLIFGCFMQQGKLNAKENDNYKKACEILQKYKDINIERPLSPSKWTAKQWGIKGTTIFLGSIVSVFAISQAVLTYDYTALLSYAITIIFGIVFGVLQMNKAELYWTEEFLLYAKSFDQNKETENNDNSNV